MLEFIKHTATVTILVPIFMAVSVALLHLVDWICSKDTDV